MKVPSYVTSPYNDDILGHGIFVLDFFLPDVK